MAIVASGILKQTSWKKQTGLNVAASGTGGKSARRTSSTFKADRDTFESNEIVTHRQSTGLSYGLQKADGKIDALLSSGTYADFFGSILSRDFTAVAAGAAFTGTTALVSGYTYTVTRSAGSYITDGLKIGNVVRLTGAHANNINKNLLITALTALVATVLVLNSTAMTAEAAVTTYVVTVVGKKTYAPITGHTKDYYSVEEFYADLVKSELYTDMRVGSMAVSLPATGNATVSTDFVGLARVLGTAQVLTSPALTSTAIMSAANGAIYIGGAVQAFATAINFTVANSAENSGAVIGSNSGNDVTTGRIKVTGTITGQFDSTTLMALFNAETATSVIVVLTADETATSDFVAFAMSKIKLTGDSADDGEKVITRTYPFTAEYDSLGGATSANEQSILAINDSAA